MLKSGLIAAVLSAASLLPVASAQAQTTMKLGWTTSNSETDPYAVGARFFKEEVERASNNEIVIDLFPNRQLGDEKQLLEGLRFGTVDLALVTNSVVSQIEPSFQLLDLPFLFASAEQAHEVLDSDVGTALAANLEGKGIVTLGYTEGGFRQMLNNKKPVNEPADVAGVKYRVMQNPMFIAMFNDLGGSAVPMAWGETYTAVQQGTIDGLEGAVSVFYSSKFQDITRYLSITNHNYSAVELLASARSMNRLSEEQQTILRDAAARTVVRQRERAGQLAVEALELIQKDGVEVNEVDDVAAFREAVAPIYDNARLIVGDELLDKTLEMLR